MLAAGYNPAANAGISVNRDAYWRGDFDEAGVGYEHHRRLFEQRSSLLNRQSCRLVDSRCLWVRGAAEEHRSKHPCGHSFIKTQVNMWLQLTQMPTTSWSAPLTDLLDRSASTCCSVLLFLITARWAESSCRLCTHELAADELSKIFSFLLEGMLRWLLEPVVIPLLHPRHLILKRASLSSPKRITVALTRCSAGFTLINKMEQAPMYKKTLNHEKQFILTGVMIEIKTLAEMHVCQPH